MSEEIRVERPLTVHQQMEQIFGPIRRKPEEDRDIFQQQRRLIEDLQEKATFIKEVLQTPSFEETDRLIQKNGLDKARRELRTGKYTFPHPHEYLHWYITTEPYSAFKKINFYVLEHPDSLMQEDAIQASWQYANLKRQTVLHALGEDGVLEEKTEIQDEKIEAKIGEFLEKATDWITRKRILSVLNHDAPTPVRLQNVNYQADIRYGNNLGSYHGNSYYENLIAYEEDFMTEKGRKKMESALNRGWLSTEELEQTQSLLTDYWTKIGQGIAEAVRRDGIKARFESDRTIRGYKTMEGKPFPYSYDVEDFFKIREFFPGSQEKMEVTDEEIGNWTMLLEERKKKEETSRDLRHKDF